MLGRTGSLFLGALVLLPAAVSPARAEDSRGQAIAQALLEAYAPQQQFQATSHAGDASRNQALSLANSILNSLATERAPRSGLAAAPLNSRPAAALNELKKLQDVLQAIREHEPATSVPVAPPAAPLINTRELVQLFDNPVPQQDLRTQLKAASESYPDNAVVWFLRAYQEQQLGHQSESKAALEQALSTVPEGLIPESIREQLKHGVPATP